MRKIAIIGTKGYPYVYGGYETFVKEIVERLNDKLEIHIYCHKSLFKSRPSSVKGVFLHYVPAIETKTLSQLSHSFLSTIHAIFHNYDVLFFVNTANGPFGLLAKLFLKKIVINTDGVEWHRPKWKGLGSKYFYFSSWLTAKVFDVLISDSIEMQSLYKKLFKRDSIVIAYGANIKFDVSEKSFSNFGLQTAEYFLIVGRLIPDNNADIIVKGYLKSGSSKKLVIVGDVPYKDKFVDYIKSFQSDSILFTGYVTDQEELFQLYSNSFAYLHGHEYGGTNPTLLKALAYGCAILALDTPFSREVLADDEYGLYFIKDLNSVAECIRFAESNVDKLNMLRKIARNRITDNYTWEKVAGQYLDLFSEMSDK
ncbi:MAG: DUF1972 domain-containing protein [Cyclobacteriaceae bacterium]|nr:DUF1972 domain-containing protein [Cyclobacteriaceae bacterium]